MGLTIHYSARVPSVEALIQMTREVQDICHSLGWQFQIIDTKVQLSSELMTHLGLSAAEKRFYLTTESPFNRIRTQSGSILLF